MRNLSYVLEQHAATDPGTVREILEDIVHEAQREIDAIVRATKRA